MRWGVIIVVLVLAAGIASAQPASPGPLGASHAHVACDGCHVNATPALAVVRCTGCHAALVQRGLHARPIIHGKPCWTCHGDHRGAAFDLQNWRALPGGMQRFDHAALAGWGLAGAHARAACTRCHTGTMASGATRFAGLSTTCGAPGCHQANPHRFAGPELLRCDRCHTEDAWKPVKRDLAFDHDTETRLPLVGAHRRACVDCHPDRAFAIAKATCRGCHAPRHASPLFDARPCEACHDAALGSFAAHRFDHGETRFPLDAGHRIACVRCHTVALGIALPSTRCEDCHRQRSPHGTRFDAVPGGCATCHTAAKWRSPTAFPHGRHTKFALVGKHAQIACRDCHRAVGPARFEALAGGCKDCHAHATVHADEAHPQGRYTSQQCIQCHGSSTPPPPRPRIASMFHGPRSTFPLVKGHRAVPCTDCHVERTPSGKTAFDAISPECGRCHEDTAHAGALGARCTRCHVSGTWEALTFEHERYRLEGPHVDVACARCHGPTKRFAGAPRRCADAACHARDDAHRGRLGATCDRCHLANGENRFNHAISSKFRLDGKHLAVPCADCHPSVTFKPRPFACAGCHPEPRVHFGRYGTWCERCHTTNGWR